MPELPEVETVKRSLTPLLGRCIAQANLVHALRLPYAPHLATNLQGQTFTSLTRRGKYLLLGLSSGATLVCHLGMTGNLFLLSSLAQLATLPHAHFSLLLSPPAVPSPSAPSILAFNDPRRFGQILWQPSGTTLPALAKLGVEPLSPAFTPARLRQICAKRSTPIKTLLLDQTLLAGLGNIYVCEALFIARISPLRPARSLTTPELARLVPAIRALLRSSIRMGGTSFRDYRHPDGHRGSFVSHLQVYGHAGQPCPVCSTPLTRVIQAGRSTFYCRSCQR